MSRCALFLLVVGPLPLVACGSGTATRANGGEHTSSTSGPDATPGPGPSIGGRGGEPSSSGAGTGGDSADASGPESPGGSGGSAGASSDAGTAAADPAIAGAVATVSASRTSTAIDKLAAFTTRNTCSNDTASGNTIGAARDWVRLQYQAIPGLTVSLDDFTYTGCAGGTVTNQNVVAVKLGAHPDRVFVIGGHYDSRTIGSTDPTSPAPGANDSGSQTAALLEIARAMAPLQMDATVMFASFSGEEQCLCGSAQLVKDFQKFVTPAAKVEAMIDLDIVGGDNVANNAAALQQYRIFSPGTPREFNIPVGTTDNTSPSRGLMRYVGYWGDVYVPSMSLVPVLHEDRPGRGSDHESFINAGIPGVRFIETVESPNAATVASHQHSPNDLPQYVTPDYTARIAQIVIGAGATLARAPSPPQMAGVTGKATSSITVSWSPPGPGPAVDHYVLAARPTTENFYHTRVAVPATAMSKTLTGDELGISGGAAFFISVAAVDAGGHESLFAYPEYRCDGTSCVVPAGALNVTARN